MASEVASAFVDRELLRRGHGKTAIVIAAIDLMKDMDLAIKAWILQLSKNFSRQKWCDFYGIKG